MMYVDEKNGSRFNNILEFLISLVQSTMPVVLLCFPIIHEWFSIPQNKSNLHKSDQNESRMTNDEDA